MASYLLRSLVDPILPWDVDEAESNRYITILVVLLVLSIALSVVIPFIEVEKPDRDKRTSIPPRLVKMVLEQKKKEVKPPPPPVEEPKEEEPKEEEPKKEEKKEEPKPEKNAKEVAKKHIAVFDALADLRDQDDMDELKKNKSLSNDQGEQAKVTRSLITKNATQGSGGIQVATASRSSGTGSLAGQNTTNVKSEIGDAVANLERTDRSGNSTRSSENIQLAFDKNSAAIYRLYQRALRKNPSLKGTVKFRLVIQPSGKVTKCEVVASELDDQELLKRIVSRIKRINFGALDVAVWDDTYLMNFFEN